MTPLSISQARGLREPGPRRDPDSHDHELRVDDGSVPGEDALHRPGPLESLDGGLGQELDAVVAMEVEIDPAELGAEDPLERQRGHLDHRHLASLLAGGGGDLGADPAGPDDHQPLAVLDPLADQLGIAEGPQVVDAVEIGAGHVEAPRHAAGGQQQAVVAQAPVSLEQELAHAEVDARHPGRGQKLDLVLGVEGCPGGRTACRPPPSAGTPWRAAGARRAARPRRRSAPADRRSPPRAASLRPWPRPGRRRRSRISCGRACRSLIGLSVPLRRPTAFLPRSRAPELLAPWRSRGRYGGGGDQLVRPGVRHTPREGPRSTRTRSMRSRGNSSRLATASGSSRCTAFDAKRAAALRSDRRRLHA